MASVKNSRRNFLAQTALGLGGYGLLHTSVARSFTSEAPKNYRGAASILQGYTNSNSAQFTILTPATAGYGYVVKDTNGVSYSVTTTRRETRSHSSVGVDKILVRGLKLGTIFTLSLISPSTGKTVDERFFKALDLNKSNARFVVGSCMKDTFNSLREEMWDAIAAAKPDVVFLVGDTCYADNDNDGSDAGYWRRYVETRSLLSHFRQKTLIPTLATWDDHDYADNNADETFPKKEMTKDLFKLFWDNELQSGLKKGPGVSQIFSAFGQRFFLMDSRYFRSSRTETLKPVQWGAAQEDFLFENLAQSSSPAFLMNGSQFFGGYLKKDAFEYWQGANLKEICRRLSQQKAPVAFISGDVHFSEVMKIEPSVLGYQSHEFTSSSLHSIGFPGLQNRKKNPRRMDATGVHTFMLFESKNQGPQGWSIRSQALGKKLKVYVDESVVIQR